MSNALSKCKQTLAGDVVSIERTDDEEQKLMCLCGKRFSHPNSLRRHCKFCTFIPIEEEDDASMEVSTDMTEVSRERYKDADCCKC
jgi:hypothetical protein